MVCCRFFIREIVVPGNMSNRLDRWFANQRSKQFSAVWLDEALFGNRFWPYVFYRLRIFGVRVAAELARNAIEFFLIFSFLSTSLGIAVLVVRGVLMLANAFWWGALERMREEIRDLREHRKGYRIRPLIEGWMAGATVVAICTGAIWMAACVAAFFLTAAPIAVQVLIMIFGLELAWSIVLRAYHSGAYAIRRIYRPILVVVALQTINAGLALLLKPVIGIWALPIASTINTILAGAIAWKYISQAYSYLQLLPLTVVLSRKRFFWFLKRCDNEFLWAGMSRMLAQSEWLLMLGILGVTIGRNDDSPHLWMSIYLALPLFSASRDWAQLFYFDIKKLGPLLFENIRLYYEALVERIALAAGLLGSIGVATIIAWTASLEEAVYYFPLILAFFLMHSLVAYEQVRAFSNRRYVSLARSGFLLLGVMIVAGIVADDFAWMILAVGLAMLLNVWILNRKHDVQILSEPVPLNAGLWAYRLGSVDESVCIGAVRLDPATTRWFLERLAQRLKTLLADRGEVTLVSDCLVLWFLRGGRDDLGIEDSLLRSAGSRIVNMERSPWLIPQEETLTRAMQNLVPEHLLGVDENASGSLASHSEIEHQYADQRAFIGLTNLMHTSPERPMELSDDYRGIMSGAVRSARYGLLSREAFANRLIACTVRGKLFAIFTSRKAWLSREQKSRLFRNEVFQNLELGVSDRHSKET